MNTEAVLTESGIATNDESVCLDRSKRDRLVWIGDFAHGARTIGASTNRMDFITGTMESVYNRQLGSGEGKGLVPTNAQMGASAVNKGAYYPTSYALLDYQIFFLLATGYYCRLTGDVTMAEIHWNGTKLLVDAMMELIDPVTGLIASSDGIFFLGPPNGTAVTCLFTLALEGLIPMAEAVNDRTTSVFYQKTVDKLGMAVNSKLWTNELGVYSNSATDLGNFSIAGL